MARWHIDEIEKSISQIGFKIIERIEPSEKESFIGGWVIKRKEKYIIEFDGIFDSYGNTIKNPSIDKAFGCSIKETKIDLYFYKKGNKWKKNLNAFISQLNEL